MTYRWLLLQKYHKKPPNPYMLFPLAENNEELRMPVSIYVYIMHISYWYTDVCIYRYQHRIGVTLVCIHVCETDRAWVHTQVQNCLKTDQVTLCRIPFTSLHQSIYWKFWHLTDDSPILKNITIQILSCVTHAYL